MLFKWTWSLGDITEKTWLLSCLCDGHKCWLMWNNNLMQARLSFCDWLKGWVSIHWSQNQLGWNRPPRSLSLAFDQSPPCQLKTTALRAMSSHFFNISSVHDSITFLSAHSNAWPFPLKILPDVQLVPPLVQLCPLVCH